MRAPVSYIPSLPTREKLSTRGVKSIVTIYDEKLLQYPNMKVWLQAFDRALPVRAGENLKSIDEFPKNVRKLLPLLADCSPRESLIVSVGGGSVGDAVGFLASTLKRGVRLIHVPTTWLSAVDSAHGGKTALNVDDVKNQVGTFYPAERIYCVRDVLVSQGGDAIRSASGEILKMALVHGSALYTRLKKHKKWDAVMLWSILPKVVEAKYQVVRKDPFETKGIRHILNFGHTLGHVLELEQMIPHGIAVHKGMEFALAWSEEKGFLKPRIHDEIKPLFSRLSMPPMAPVAAERVQRLLRQDKKAVHGHRVKFVFLRRPGETKIESVEVDEIVRAAQRLGFAK